MVNNKKGQQMTLGTIIAIVLGIAVLVFLIFGFSTGWSGLWDRVTQFGGESNVDTVAQACALKCSTGDKFAFCTEDRTLNDGTETIDVIFFCKNFFGYTDSVSNAVTKSALFCN